MFPLRGGGPPPPGYSGVPFPSPRTPAHHGGFRFGAQPSPAPPQTPYGAAGRSYPMTPATAFHPRTHSRRDSINPQFRTWTSPGPAHHGFPHNLPAQSPAPPRSQQYRQTDGSTGTARYTSAASSPTNTISRVTSATSTAYSQGGSPPRPVYSRPVSRGSHSPQLYTSTSSTTPLRTYSATDGTHRLYDNSGLRKPVFEPLSSHGARTIIEPQTYTPRGVTISQSAFEHATYTPSSAMPPPPIRFPSAGVQAVYHGPTLYSTSSPVQTPPQRLAGPVEVKRVSAGGETQVTTGSEDLLAEDIVTQEPGTPNSPAQYTAQEVAEIEAHPSKALHMAHRKAIPAWATDEALRNQLVRQQYLSPDEIFPPIVTSADGAIDFRGVFGWEIYSPINNPEPLLPVNDIRRAALERGASPIHSPVVVHQTGSPYRTSPLAYPSPAGHIYFSHGSPRGSPRSHGRSPRLRMR